MFRVFLFCVFISLKGTAQQYVTVDDKNFALFLQQEYPTCMLGNQLEITSPLIATVKSLSINELGIKNLEAIRYFSQLKSLECLGNALTSLPPLPSTLVRLDCCMNQLNELPALPASLEELSCAANNLSMLPVLPINLKVLYCNFNRLTALPALPENLEYLACGSNLITCLPPLPASIFMGDIALNPLSCITNSQDWMDDESKKLPVCASLIPATTTKCLCISVSLLDEQSDDKTADYAFSAAAEMSIFPNPTTGLITVVADQDFEALSVKNIEGKSVNWESLMTNESEKKNRINIDLSRLCNGIYFIQSTIGSQSSIYKILKSN
jgi:Leucine-rich repeat (LRR) protein